MKLGGSVLGHWKTAEEWLALLKATRFAAITCPVDSNTDASLAQEVVAATKEAGVLIAEAGIWQNVLSPDQKTRDGAMDFAKRQLAFADAHGIPCVVNIAGARGSRWDGAYRDNYSAATYELIIDSVREIIDSVQPATACYTLEPMPWMLPDGPDEYLQLMQDINREHFAVHLDCANMLNSPRRFLFANEFVEECLVKLGPFTKSTHLKDSLMQEELTTLIHEAQPGKGQLDLAAMLGSLHRHLSADAPVLLEHMGNAEDYARAYDKVAEAAKKAGVPIR